MKSLFMILARIVLIVHLVNGFSIGVRTNTQPVKVTWEVDVEETIRYRVQNGMNQNGEPYMVAVVGIPGSGKTTGAEILTERLRDLGTLHMPFDGYHYSLSTLRSMPDPDDIVYRRGAPDTFDNLALLRDLERIRYGDEPYIPLPGFDHGIGDPIMGEHLFQRDAHKIVICEGLYLLHDENGWDELKTCFDLSVYVDAPLELCMERLKIRNRKIPGYTPEEIDIRVDVVDRTNALYVGESKRRADIIVRSAAHEI